MKLKSLLALVTGVAFAVCAYADTWYADASKDAGTGDGTSPATAFHTIQEAVNAAAADDTIYVAEGVYNDGTTNGIWTTTHGKDPAIPVDQRIRVYVTKKLNIIATGAKEKTVILGDQGTTSSDKDTHKSPYYRLDCVTCMVIGPNANGSRIKGFTFDHGFVHQSAGGDSLAAGGVCLYNTKLSTAFADAFTVVNCDFNECYGRGAGAINGGTAFRCTFKACISSYRAAAAFRCRLFNCLAIDSSYGASSQPEFVDCLVVNCTTHNSFGRFGFGRVTKESDLAKAIPGFGVAYNSVCYGNVNRWLCLTDIQSAGIASNVVSDIDPTAVNGSTPRTGRDFDEGSADVVYLNPSDAAGMTNVCVCPALFDFHPVKDGQLDGKGKLNLVTALEFVPDEELALDFYGQPFAGELPIGLVLPAKEPKSGVFKTYSYQFRVNGRDMSVSYQYLQSATWPAQVKLRGSSKRTKDNVLGITICKPEDQSKGLGKVFKGAYEDVVMTLPPKTEVDGSPTPVYPLTLMEYKTELFVNVATGDDGNNDGKSAEAPFKSISRAIESIDGWTLIHVARGTYKPVAAGGYEEGGAWETSPDVKGTVFIPREKTVLIVADEGPDVTFIEGMADPGTDGVGDNAYRCVMINGSADGAVAGFTLRNGYTTTWTVQSGTSTAYKNGGAVLCGTSDPHILDCRITGAHGAAALQNGTYVRCTVTNNVDLTECVATGGDKENLKFSACVIAANCPTLDRILYNYGRTYNCTIWQKDCDLGCYAVNKNGWMVNGIVDTAGQMLDFPANYPVVGSVIMAWDDKLVSYPAIHETPGLNAPWGGDFRLHEPSPAINCGVVQDENGVIPTPDMLRYVRGDIQNRFLVRADGSVFAGAVAETTPASDIYVDANGGNDDNDGLSEATAKKTLQAAADLSETMPANARIIALPGVYKEGSRVHVGRAYHGNAKGFEQPTIKSRVIVPAERILISRDGPETTAIEGASDTTEKADAYGRGPNAIRGAMLERFATLSGFTIRKGRSDFWRSDKEGGEHATLYQDDLFAGGVLGRGGQGGGTVGGDTLGGAVVANCILTDNSAPNGGAGCLLTFRHCFVTNNFASSYGGFFRHGEAYDCYVITNSGPRVCDCVFNLVNCTFEDNMNAARDGMTQLAANVEKNGKIWNVLNISTATTDNFDTGDLRNLVMNKGLRKLWNDEAKAGTVENINTNFTYRELKAMYAGGVPVALDAPTVDLGTDEARSLLSEKDIVGNPRVQNGTIDIGAFEADWRGAYAATLGRRVTVTETSPSVVMTDGHPLMQGGDVLAATISARSSVAQGSYVVRATLTGGGKMLVYLNGALLGELTASGELRFTNDRETNDLRFEYAGEGSAYVAKVAQELGALLIVR